MTKIGELSFQTFNYDNIETHVWFLRGKLLHVVEFEGEQELISRGVYAQLIWDNIRLKQMGLV